MKIAVLGHRWMPLKEDGTEIVMEELASWMVAEDRSVACYNRHGYHVGGAEFDDRQLSEYESIKVKAVPTINRRGLVVMTSNFFTAVEAALGRYGIVYIHARGPTTMCWIPKLCRKMIVIIIHGLDWKREK